MFPKILKNNKKKYIAKAKPVYTLKKIVLFTRTIIALFFFVQ